MKEIVVVTSNDVGALASIAEAIGGLGANIEAISAYGMPDKAVFRIITSDVTSSLKAIVYKMMNRPGELGKITRKLANRGVNIESLYIVSRKQDFTEVAIRPVEKDLEKAKEALGMK
jgi:hypothetical protein